MRVLIRRRVDSAAGGHVFHETELSGNAITIGSGLKDQVQFAAADVSRGHAQLLLEGKGRATLKVAAPYLALVNGNSCESYDVVPGDLVKFGESEILVLPPPAGFDFAIEVTGVSALSDSDTYVAAFTASSLPIRRMAWLSAGAVLLFCLLLPLFVRQWTPESTVNLPAAFTHAAWSSGKLHVSHRDAASGDCTVCHSTPFERVADSSCTQCHEQIAEHAPANALTSQTSQTLQMSQTSQMSQTLPPIRCASCHLEHNEPSSLLSIEDAQCSSCHDVSGFSLDHPEFDHYPHLDRTNIIFDHSTHAAKHFSETSKAFECSSCHEPDIAGQRMVTQGMDTMCIDCHGESDSKRPSKVLHHGDQLVNSGTLAFFTLPRLDTKQLNKREITYGYWPDGTRRGSRKGLTRLGLTPVTEFLLAAEPDVASALTNLRQARVKLASLAKADEQNIADVLVVIKALRRLLGELAIDPVGAIGQRVERWRGRALTHRERLVLGGRLSAELVRGVALQWFADDPKMTHTELATYFSADSSRIVSGAPDSLPGAVSSRLGSWREEKFSLQYQLSGHADDLARAWVELVLELGWAANAAADREEVVALRALLLDDAADTGSAKSLGRCSKCHDLKGSAASVAVTWSPSWRDAPAGSADFEHATHVRDAESCGNCHESDSGEKSTYLQVYTGIGGGNFKPITKALCAQCHAPDSTAGEACGTCHEYHLGHGGGTAWLLLEPSIPAVEPLSDAASASLK